MLWIPSHSFFATHLALNGGQLFEFNPPIPVHRLHSCVLSAAGRAAKDARACSKNAGNLNTWHGEITGYFCKLHTIADTLSGNCRGPASPPPSSHTIRKLHKGSADATSAPHLGKADKKTIMTIESINVISLLCVNSLEHLILHIIKRDFFHNDAANFIELTRHV